MTYELPTSVTVNGREYAIRSDYRVVLDIISALSDPELDNENKALETLDCFYPDFVDMPISDYTEALKQCFLFISSGEEPNCGKQQPKLMDWNQDFGLIVGPVNRIIGREIRALEYLHWYTFLSAYQEVGDCAFAQVVSIRRKKLRGKKLDASEREFYQQNRKLVDFKRTYTSAEEEIVGMWV